MSINNQKKHNPSMPIPNETARDVQGTMKKKMKLPRNLSGEDSVKLSNLLSSLFAVKGITFEQFEIYLWTEEKGERVKTFEVLERGDDYHVIFCLSNVKLSIDRTPFTFKQFDFNCRCDNGKCCDLYISPDVFDFNAEEDINVETLQKMEEEVAKRLSGIVQALFSLSSR